MTSRSSANAHHIHERSASQLGHKAHYPDARRLVAARWHCVRLQLGMGEEDVLRLGDDNNVPWQAVIGRDSGFRRLLIRLLARFFGFIALLILLVGVHERRPCGNAGAYRAPHQRQLAGLADAQAQL